MEKRRNPRLRLILPCRLVEQGGAWCAQGATVDVTRRGALIECAQLAHRQHPPQEGDTVIVEIALPDGPVERRCFRGRAKVVRLSGAGGPLQLAVEFSRLQFAAWEPERREAGCRGGHRMGAVV